jgi:hypothetical protein
MGVLIIGCRRDEDFILAAGGEMAAAATVHRDVVLVCLQEGFKACDALIWTLCHQDVRIVGFLRQSVRSSVDKIAFTSVKTFEKEER